MNTIHDCSDPFPDKFLEDYCREIVAHLDPLVDGYSIAIYGPQQGFDIWRTETESESLYSVYMAADAVMLRQYSLKGPDGCQTPQRRDDLLFADPKVHPEAIAKIIAGDLANTLPFAEALEKWNGQFDDGTT